MILRFLAALLFCFSFFYSIPAHAQIGAVFGIGPVSESMGSTSLVHGKPNAFNAYAAPAALGFIRNPEVSVGAQYMSPSLRPYGTLVINSNRTLGEFRESGVLPGGGQLLAIAIPFGKVRPLTIGAAFYLPFSTLVRVSGTPVNYPFYPIYTDISRNLFYVVGAGYEIFDGWALGINLRSTTKSIAAYSLRADSSVNYSASAVEARGQTRYSFSIVYDGEKKNPDFPFTVGAMYRARAGLETKLSADISAFVPVQGSLTSTPTFSPAEWVLMSSAKLSESLIASMDLAWVKWSEYSSPYGSGNINTYIINSNTPAGFKDRLVPRAGAQYKKNINGTILKDLILRGGYSFQKSPVPNQDRDSNFVDNDRHSFTSGLGFALKNPWQETSDLDLDFFAQYNWLHNRKITKISATNIGAPGYISGGSILLFGAGVTIRF